MKNQLFEWRDRRFELFVGGLFFAMSFIVGYTKLQVFLQSKADTAVQQLAMVAEAVEPVISSVIVSTESYGIQISSLTPIEGSVFPVYVHGVVTDLNGCSDLKDVQVTVHRNDLASSCQANPENCYTATTTLFQGCTGVSDLSAEYEVVVPVLYFADPTDGGSPFSSAQWVAKAVVRDEADLVDLDESMNFEVNSLASFSVTHFVDFGELSLGEIAQPQPLSFRNLGNRLVRPLFSSVGGFDCSNLGSASIPPDFLRIATGAEVVAITTTTATTDGLNLITDAQKEALWDQVLPMLSMQDTPLNEQVFVRRAGVDIVSTAYLVLKIPSTDVEGVCSIVLNFTADSL